MESLAVSPQPAPTQGRACGTRVLKFGGSSVADAAAMRRAAAIVDAARPAAPLVVLSAMGKTTDALFAAARAAASGDLATALAGRDELRRRHLAAADDLFAGAPPPLLVAALDGELGRLSELLNGVAMLRELTPRTMDAIAATGELLSTRLFAAFVGGEWFDVRAILRTDRRFGAARPDAEALATRAAAGLAPRVGAERVVVTQGYVGAAAGDGSTTTLGRGGSDYSAALLGAALGADEVQIWTDVEGVMTADPRLVGDALPIAELSFAEAAELAAFGARVLHPATIEPAVEAGIPVTVRHTARPHGRFTTISAHGSSGRAVTAIAARSPVSVLTVTASRMLAESGFLARLFEPFARRGISIDLVATAEVAVSLTVDEGLPGDELADLIAELSTFARVEVAPRRAIAAVIGERMRSTPGIAARLFTALGDLNAEMVSMGANEINLSLVVRAEVADEAVRRLHRVIAEEAA